VSTNTITRFFVATAIAATLAPTSARALVSPIIVPPKLPITGTELSKPPAVTHADVPPSVPGANSAPAPVTAAPVPVPAVPAPDGSGEGSTHVVDASSSAGSDQAVRSFDGSNRISFGSFRDGDMVVVLDWTSLTGHAGLFDRRYYSSLYSFAVWSANVSPVNGVQREQGLKFRAYDRAYGLWVPRESDHRTAARNFAARQVGKPYSVLASKTDLRSFYCSKLAWAAWRFTSGLDLDGDGGFWVWPVDLVRSRYTSVFGYWS
jgi:hypothetical protein